MIVISLKRQKSFMFFMQNDPSALEGFEYEIVKGNRIVFELSLKARW